ncbi:MAG TPA: excinuclease ABC subunit UvrA, partial [Pirellulales bacterium]|nr:excinuclease ABC subunit UvrA [Pirellulales bacterium]
TAAEAAEPAPSALIVVDRLAAGAFKLQRLRDSLENAFQHGHGTAIALIETDSLAEPPAGLRSAPLEIDGRVYQRQTFSTALRCEQCGREFPPLEPRLFNFNSPLGACPVCEGFGNVIELDWKLIVPNAAKSLRDGAIAPWTTPAYVHELHELLALAEDFQLPVDIPCDQLTEAQWHLVREGVPERKFGGLKGFFEWLERRKYKTPIRVFLNRWKSAAVCPACRGRRLRPEALSVRVGGKGIAEWGEFEIAPLLEFLRGLELSEHERRVAALMLDQVRARLGFLESVGLGYLTLDRTLKTLSAGETQRVELTSTLGSTLVGMLYVLDEPSAGLHPRDVHALLDCIQRLRGRGNTVVVVEHEEQLIRAADQVVEIGPGAGERGGEVVFQGPPAEICAQPKSLTGDYLAGRRGFSVAFNRRPAKQGRLRLTQARGHNLKNLNVEFPLGLLCLVTGVSGSGKSTLVQDTLYPALCQRLKQDVPPPLPFDDIFGDGQLEHVALVDQSPIGCSPRSNPVTYIKAFDEIRNAFAETADAKLRNLTPSHFSFNVEGGRCPNCDGDGFLAIDMQFLADIYMKCPQCHGRRYRKEILQVKYRNKSIADVLEMTAREAFSFFRGSLKVQARLKQLMDVGLDYLRLGQPANTLSGGEAQRLKLAAFLAAKKRGRSLFILDEPTTGLHFADVTKLLDCFEALISVGHSLIVIEHNVQMMKAADWIIDLGPGAAAAGGQIVAAGTPEQIAEIPESATGQILAEIFARYRREMAEIED